MSENFNSTLSRALKERERFPMLYIIGLVLMSPGILGFVSSNQMDSYIHWVLAGFLVLFLIGFFQKEHEGSNRLNKEHRV
jgi:hypothetical protein